jgi:hypothetical protein
MIDQSAFPQEVIDRNTRSADEWIAAAMSTPLVRLDLTEARMEIENRELGRRLDAIRDEPW